MFHGSEGVFPKEIPALKKFVMSFEKEEQEVDMCSNRKSRISILDSINDQDNNLIGEEGRRQHFSLDYSRKHPIILPDCPWRGYTCKNCMSWRSHAYAMHCRKQHLDPPRTECLPTDSKEVCNMRPMEGLNVRTENMELTSSQT